MEKINQIKWPIHAETDGNWKMKIENISDETENLFKMQLSSKNYVEGEDDARRHFEEWVSNVFWRLRDDERMVRLYDFRKGEMSVIDCEISLEEQEILDALVPWSYVELS